MTDRVSRLRDSLSDFGDRFSRRATTVPGVAAVSVMLVGLIVGSGAFLLNPTAAEESEASAPSDEQLDAARGSLGSAQMMFEFMSGAAASATGSIEQITGSAGDIFNAVDTASGASGQLVTALENAPNLAAASQQVNDGTLAISGALNQASTIAEAATQLDSLVTPLIDVIESAPGGEQNDALELLRSLRDSSRDIEGNLGSLQDLRGELDRVSQSVQGAAGTVDGAVDQALTSAQQLQEGLAGLAAARGDVESGAADINSGIARLSGVLSTISADLQNAQANLTPEDLGQAGVAPAPAGVDGTRVGWSILFGAGAGLVMLAGVLVARRMGKGPNDQQTAVADPTETSAPQDTTDEDVSVDEDRLVSSQH